MRDVGRYIRKAVCLYVSRRRRRCRTQIPLETFTLLVRQSGAWRMGLEAIRNISGFTVRAAWSRRVRRNQPVNARIGDFSGTEYSTGFEIILHGTAYMLAFHRPAATRTATPPCASRASILALEFGPITNLHNIPRMPGTTGLGPNLA